MEVGGARGGGVWATMAAFGAERLFLRLLRGRRVETLVEFHEGGGGAYTRERRTVGGPSLLPSLSSS